jgi:hypothetical protein
MNGAATKKGKFNGREFNVKKGIMKDIFPIITCKNFREDFPEKPKSLDACPDRRMTNRT